MKRTYLQESLKNNAIERWPDTAFPLKVYIAPFRWYEKQKQMQAEHYRQVVVESLQTWTRATNGRVSFTFVSKLDHSQIDFRWRRVDRRSLGHCVRETNNKHQVFSAEIHIGISDGLLHAQYNQLDEVRHTIIHEIGHALGLEHSDGNGDIMYVPHQYGIFNLSPRDTESIRWLYELPVGFDYTKLAAKYRVKGHFDINTIIDCIEAERTGQPLPHQQDGSAIANSPDTEIRPPEQHPPGLIHKTASIQEQHDILSDISRFHLKTQHIQVASDKLQQLRQGFKRRPPQPPQSP